MSVRTGLDVLLGDSTRLGQLKGRRVGLLVNPTSVTNGLRHAVDALRDAGVNIVRLFGPEHGVRGEAQDMEVVVENVDPITGIPTVSLYGHTFDSLKPKPADLDGLDVVIADIQDIGARYYTYIYTIGLMMDACGEAGIDVWVLDRPNPIDATKVEGNVLLDEYKSFVGMQPMAVRHGMTTGEAARFFDRFGGWQCDLTVVELEGYRRGMWFDETGLPWVMPSPNMPTLETAVTYPGQCILEGTNISEGRGTTRPFELFGAPWIDAARLCDRMRAYDLPGCQFREVSFRPKFQKHGGATCAGAQVHVTDRSRFESITMTFCLLSELQAGYPEDFRWREEAYEYVGDKLAIDLLIGDPVLRKGLEDGQDPVELAHIESSRRKLFDERRAACLIYPE